MKWSTLNGQDVLNLTADMEEGLRIVPLHMKQLLMTRLLLLKALAHAEFEIAMKTVKP